MKLLANILTFLPGFVGKLESTLRLNVMDGAIEVFDGEKLLASILLQDVESIVAFKRDMLTTDLVCFVFRVSRSSGSMSYEVNEDVEGFGDLIRRLESCPGFNREWRSYVMQQAFTENRTVVFRR